MTSGAEVPPPQAYLRKILRTVASSDRLRQMLSEPDGVRRVLADPEIAPDAAHLTADVTNALIDGDLCKIQEALDHEPRDAGEEAAARPYWALVRV
jgi:hypothetical protein